ncbi:hypothetical protein JSQ81_11245 [Sporosarcina sp. Marseille-Q4063]|uniref:hypothetical protein n=1 Tax=Sporosarcina sp. Marseille-Q4063 TaxID=2810514 RepID=UPI001BAFA7B6|nr:hypothetical protein [Sporosarcina sp. Marseille-Q4063]QUW20437.1 hypothetical protein JSQ81_11245 [Sporosarcina sp. Marseille-Q4063]
MSEKGLKRGQPITFRIPSDTSDHTLRQLQKLKDVERRNFSSKIAEFVTDGVNDSLLKHREAIVIPLPKGLSKAQRDWLKHEHSEALLGSIVYQLLSDPNRTAALFASINSNALEVDDALYLQEETAATVEPETNDYNDIGDDDLDNFDWTQVTKSEPIAVEEEIDPLADFLAQMNK